MKNIYRTLLLLLIPCSHALATDIDVGGQVSAVTLFTRGAEVTRTARAVVTPGEHKLVFRGIPLGVNGESLRASGSGTAKVSIRGVEFRTRARREDISADTEALKVKKDDVARAIATEQQTKVRLEKEQSLLAAVRLDAIIPDGDKIVRPRTAQELTSLMQFVAQNGTRLLGEIRVVEDKLTELQKDLGVINANLQNLTPGNTTESVVEVAISVETSGETKVAITYQVPNASWSPTYNLLLASEKGPVSFLLETYGVIQQNTGEDWDRVSLILSTARPHLNLVRPVPSAHVLDIYTPITVPASVPRQFMEKGKRINAASISEVMSDDSLMKDSSPKEAEEARAFEEADAAISTVGVVRYELASSVSLKSDGSKEKVRIRSTPFTGSLLNVAVPALSSQVYREALVVNGSDAPLLPGAISIFSNGSFVGRQSVGYTAPGKEIKLSVGVSDDVSITRKLVERFEDDSGLVRSIRRIRYLYEIEVENHSSAEQQAVILEPAPLSRNDKIKIALSKEEPKSLPTGDKTRLQPDVGVFEWRLVIPPKKKQTLRYEFVVEFEAGLNVIGLDGIS